MMTYRMHGNGRKNLCRLSDSFQSRTQGQRVDHSGKHAHLIAFHSVKSLRRAFQATENIAAAYHYSDLNTGLHGLLYLPGILPQAHGVDTVALGTGERLAAEFKQHSVELAGLCHIRALRRD